MRCEGRFNSTEFGGSIEFESKNSYSLTLQIFNYCVIEIGLSLE